MAELLTRGRVASRSCRELMTTFSCSIDIDAPRAWLFDLMQSYERRLEWDEFLSRAELVGGATKAALGARAYCVDRSGRGMETEYVSFRPPERVAVKMTQGPWMFSSFAGSWVYSEISANSTSLTFRYAVEIRPRWLGAIGDSVLSKVFRADMQKRLVSAKERIERLYAAETRCRSPIGE